MKFIWETDDIVTGRKYSKPNIETWMIGYQDRSDSPEEGARYVSISMRDGLVTNPMCKENLAQHLTNEGYIPEEFLKIMIPFEEPS